MPEVVLFFSFLIFHIYAHSLFYFFGLVYHQVSDISKHPFFRLIYPFTFQIFNFHVLQLFNLFPLSKTFSKMYWCLWAQVTCHQCGGQWITSMSILFFSLYLGSSLGLPDSHSQHHDHLSYLTAPGFLLSLSNSVISPVRSYTHCLSKDDLCQNLETYIGKLLLNSTLSFDFTT